MDCGYTHEYLNCRLFGVSITLVSKLYSKDYYNPGADPGNLKGGSFTGACTPMFRPHPVLGCTHCETVPQVPLQIPGDTV